MIKVLFIDDDIELGFIVSSALKKKGIEVKFQNSLTGAKEVIKEYNPDVIILDIALNGEDGISFIPRIKDISPLTPIIIASSHTSYDEIERAFNAQAADFVKKPYVPEELSIYIRKNISKHTPHIIHIGNLALDTQTRELSMEGTHIKRLSVLEYRLLKVLANNANEIVSRKTIESELWGSHEDSNEYSINNLIAYLRKFIAADPSLSIITRKSQGYSLHVES